MKGQPSSQDRPDRNPTPTAAGPTAPRLVGEFEVHERGIALRMRIERWPAVNELVEDEPPVEAGYGHGV